VCAAANLSPTSASDNARYSKVFVFAPSDMDIRSALAALFSASRTFSYLTRW
jgi:hypothetical protein